MVWSHDRVMAVPFRAGVRPSSYSPNLPSLEPHAVVRDFLPTHSRTDRRRDCGWDQTPSSFFTDPSFTSTLLDRGAAGSLNNCWLSTLAVARRQAKVRRGVTRGSFTLFHRYRALTSDSSVDVPII